MRQHSRQDAANLSYALLSGIAGMFLAACPVNAAQSNDENPPPAKEATTGEGTAGDDDLILLETPLPVTEGRRGADKKSEDDRPAQLQAGGRVLAQARETLKRKGCEAAAPAYRVVAGMGEGFEAAQHELGDCLLTIDGKSEADTQLLRQEGMLWLNRAAHAGNARAQRRLAILHASPIAGAHNPASALKWSLVYKNNPKAELYGAGPVPQTMVDGLMADLSDADVAAAQAFAAGFTAISLPKYKPPKAARKRGRLR